MARPMKCRKVCRLPMVDEFCPTNSDNSEKIIMTVDEYEAIRLIDNQGFSQEECSVYMKVARTTAQQIYLSARKKLALMLVEGMSMRIEGGQYAVCDGVEQNCGCGGCRRHILNEENDAV